MSDNEFGYYLAFSYCLGIGPLRFSQLTDHFGDAKTAYLASKQDLLKVLGPQTTDNLIKFRNNFNFEQKIAELKQKQIHIIPNYSEQYPKLLKQVSDPPIVLYLKGNPEIFAKYQDNFFAIVGSRKTTSYGQQTTFQFSRQLSSCGLIIVSGMAAGIDTTAHNGALAANKPTIAVLGCGVDIVYPQQNYQLYHQIITTGGAVISEFPPGHLVARGLFVSRNRIISGLSKGVLVVEGNERSGALITASYAAGQGRDVFAIPSPIDSQSSKAPNSLLKQGAKLVTGIDDILEEYGLTGKSTVTTEMDLSQFSPQQRQLLTLLQNEPMATDQLSEKLSLDIDEIFNIITELEINKIIAKNNEGKYYLL